MSDHSAAALLIEEQNQRTILRGNIARTLPQSAVLPKQETTSDELLRAIERLPNIKLTHGAGTMVGQTQDGKTLNLVGLIERALLANPALADGRSSRHVQTGAVELYRSEMNSSQKAEYLKTHTIDEFMALPLKRTATFTVDEGMTRAQWLALPWRQRAALGYSEQQISDIIRRR